MKVGIDLGTTYSVVATYDRKTATAEIVRNKYLKDITPSVICFLEDGTVLIGEEAKDLQEGGVGVIASIFKVNMGTKEVCANINGREYHAEELSKLMLKELVREAEATSGEKIESAVITVPAYFDDLQRTATRSAAERAGIKVSKIINEPTAAAIYYGYKHSDGKTLLVYDLGGGTFDVTIVRISNGTIVVKGTKGDHSLGGKDWDEALVNIVCERFLDEFGQDPRDDIRKRFELLATADDYKKLLSKSEHVNIVVNYNGNSGRYSVSRDDFEAATGYLIDATVDIMDDLFKGINMSKDDVDEVLLCGGSTRLPMVVKSLEKYGFKNIRTHRDTDLAVAKGAAIVAELYSNEDRSISDLKLVDVTAHSLGALSINPNLDRYYNDIMIPCNTPIPVSVTKPFRIEEGNLTDQIEVYVLQGESPLPLDCTCVKREVITGFQNSGRGMVVDITYSYSEEGTVSVSASRNGSTLPVIEQSVPEDLSWMGHAPEERATNKRVAKCVAICVDLSRSMSEQLDEVKSAVKNFIMSFSGEFTKFALIGFGDKVKVFRGLTLDDADVMEAVDELKINSAGRGTGANPFYDLREIMEGEDGAKYAVILTDGIWGNRNIAVDEARDCRSEMINIVAVGFGKADRSFLRQIATLEEGAMYTTINNLGKTINTIATAIIDCPTAIMEHLR